ncbi:hypothetical protein GCM10009682_53270 [Luedemannella flava]|uniref:Uncharacterized protein n=1 Tax=Luedemannella flava TaxID=349316 RepID=A0ABP4YW05_9ACTN
MSRDPATAVWRASRQVVAAVGRGPDGDGEREQDEENKHEQEFHGDEALRYEGLLVVYGFRRRCAPVSSIRMLLSCPPGQWQECHTASTSCQ